MLNVLDLFSGTGELGRAFKEALEFHGIPCRTAAYCERERYPQGILLSRMLRGKLDVAPISTDVCELKPESLPPIDAIIGGFPCQDISTAGRGAGLEGKRSGLFFEVLRLARELRPGLIGLENVSAITIRGGVRVTAELAALGYYTRWGVMGADDFGGTHRRDRWWCLAFTPGRRFRELWGSRDGAGQSGERGEGLENAGCRSRRTERKAEEGRNPLSQWPADNDALGRSGFDVADAKGQRPGRDSGRLQQAHGRQESGLLRKSDGTGKRLADSECAGFPVGGNAGGISAQNSKGAPAAAIGNGLPPRPPAPSDALAWSRILAIAPEVSPAIAPPSYARATKAYKILQDKEAEPALRRMAAWIVFRNDRIRALGNGVDYVCAREAFKILLGGKKE